MNKILFLNGWQQSNLTPGEFDYGFYAEKKLVFADLPKNIDLAIGWSLGGKLLVEAILKKKIRPKKVILIAAPFKFIGDNNFPSGMNELIFQEFRTNYIANPQGTLSQFNSLIALGDNKGREIARNLNKEIKIRKNGLFWLDDLAKSDFSQSDFSDFPETTIIHGENDKIVDIANAHKFAQVIKNSHLEIWQNCGHAPHLHDLERFRKIRHNGKNVGLKTYIYIYKIVH